MSVTVVLMQASCLTGIISANRLADLERELQELIEKCKDDQALYTAIQIASGLK